MKTLNTNRKKQTYLASKDTLKLMQYVVPDLRRDFLHSAKCYAHIRHPDSV